MSDSPPGTRPPVLSKKARILAVVGISVGVVAVLGAAVVLAVVALGDSSPPKVGPVRVLLIGDSIMNQSGLYIEEELAELGGVGPVQIVNEGVNGSGLLTPELYDWRAEVPRLLEQVRPEIIVVLYVGNYTSTDLYVNEAGLEVEGYTDRFFSAWEEEARDLQRLLFGTGADIYWVNPPPLLEEEGERRVSEFRRIHRRIAEDWTDTVLIDGTAALSDPEGGYAWELPDEEGRLEQVRTLDSVHLTTHGAQLLAAEIARQIAPSIRVAQRLREPE